MCREREKDDIFDLASPRLLHGYSRVVTAHLKPRDHLLFRGFIIYIYNNFILLYIYVLLIYCSNSKVYGCSILIRFSIESS